MPAPRKLPPRKKKIKTETIELPKRSTRTRTRAKMQDGNETGSDIEDSRNVKKSSDVIIQNTTITTIEISEDSERDTETEPEIEKNKIEIEVQPRSTRSKMRKRNKLELAQDQTKSYSETEQNNEKLEQIEAKKIRSTRTKTKQKKRSRSDSIEEPSNQMEKKKSRSDSNTEQECNGSLQTEYEDAVSILENNQDKNQNANATYIASAKDSQDNNEKVISEEIANSTIIIENPKIASKDQVTIEKNLPENELEQAVTPLKKKGKLIKQIFSPFEKTPMKKKLRGLKKKAQRKNSNEEDDNEIRVTEEEQRIKITEKEKPRTFTPITSKFLPKNSERERNDVKKKEREALRKREALLQAQTEEKRRKREEKQQKAQQQREILEKEKLKQLEAQKIKEEKYKQAIAEREEKLQKQKEEAEKRRLMAKKKANELLKEKEEVIRIAEQKKYAEMKAMMDKQSEMTKLALKQKMERAQQQQSIPLYMTTKPPLLPTDDCYDSDDPEFEKLKRYREVREMQITMITAGETIKNTFFCRQAQTPDLQEIFEIIDPRKLKRTSSAIWRKPPRYTLMPTIEDQHEFSEESD
ncbi:hypothetical protein NQ314_000034 [Rhamnusium bicolor]|uniref:Uncharacterized protein n=1 Tax=Rhamnusium bicolor TaxID=1586634 RepID=A0AAV8ZZD5_9CUCU|nr:hypothetical protein NQ314_000034 [Rhamnusium bicolor]